VDEKRRRKVVIMGAAGRDFHNFNVYFRDNPNYEVVAFTASQIPRIEGRVYPPELAGELYPKGIPIYKEEELPKIIEEKEVDEVVLAYSDLSHLEVMHKASLSMSKGADFRLMGPKSTMLESEIPVIAVCAVRTGCGKSQTSRKVSRLLKDRGFSVAVVRHPMPYGDLKKQIVQRFESKDDFEKYGSTIEEREDIAPHLEIGNVVYSGVDYERILKEIEREGFDYIIWDGGNNDYPFYKPDLMIVVTDSHRPGHEVSYFPGEVNLRMADVIIINKIDTSNPEGVELIRENISRVNPNATLIEAASPISMEPKTDLRGKKVLVIEDGPTVTHGEMGYGAGYVLAKKMGAEIVDPREYAVGSIKEAYSMYKHIGKVLPALGYWEDQMRDLKETVERTECDYVILGTPVDLSFLGFDKPVIRVKYELQEIGSPSLEEVLDSFLKGDDIGRECGT